MRRRKGVVRLATCQFPVSASIRRNARWIREQVAQAKEQGADLVHFPETALSGYAHVDFPAWDGFDWDLLLSESECVRALARKARVWVVFGSCRRLTGRHLPHNSLYAIDPRGRIAGRYDKRFCAPGDLAFYTPGDHFTTFDVNGVRFGLLICHDIRYPELYREYKKLGAHCILDSFYNARDVGPGPSTFIMRPSMQTRAASNHLWISGNNASGHYQRWPSVFIRPDGKIIGQLRQHRAGVMAHEIDLGEKHFDASELFRPGVMKGKLNSGRTVKDPRSRQVDAF